MEAYAGHSVVPEWLARCLPGRPLDCAGDCAARRMTATAKNTFREVRRKVNFFVDRIRLIGDSPLPFPHEWQLIFLKETALENGKRIANWVLWGSLIGVLITSWLAPKMIIWYFTPPVDYGFNCSAPITWALMRLRYVQLVGLASGAVLGLVSMLVWSRRRRAALKTSV